MSRGPALVFYISGHGFGHASRDIEVINAVAARAPSLPIQVRTIAPRWLFDLTARTRVEVCSVECDTGIVQIDSLRLDAGESIRRAAAFHRDFDRRAMHEVRALDSAGARLVVGDIPPLAFAAAARAGVRAWALGNFTWDWIYEDYTESADAPDLVPTIRSAYAMARGAWRLPMWGGFDSFARVEDVPLVARHSRRTPAEVRRHFNLSADRAVVLVSFGGFGVNGLPLERIDCLDRFAVVVADTTISRSGLSTASGHVVGLNEDSIYDNGYRYEDLVATADVVVTKPGFGIIAECAANDTAIVYTSRGHFREYGVLVREMPKYVRCAFLSQEDLLAGRWGAALDRVLVTTAPPPPRTDGADVVAGLILDAFETL